MDNKDIRSEAYSSLLGHKQSQKGIFNIIIIVLIFSLVSGFLGYYVGDNGYFRYLTGLLNNESRSPDAKIYTEQELATIINPNAYDMNLYQQLIANLKDKYVDPKQIDEAKLFDSSLKGLVEGVGDPATVYMNPEDFKQYQQSFSGTFEGIGVRLEYDKNRIVVSDVIQNSPAEKADVKEGYIFLQVDGKSVEQDTLDELVQKVRGQSGSKVKIKFFDTLRNESIDKEITRGPVNVESIRVIRKDQETAILEVSRFTEPTVEEWERKWDAAVKEINDKGYSKVILDLRGNLGGYLAAGIYAANDFMEPGKLVVTERTRNGGDKEVKTTNNNPKLKDKKVVILINGGTASAAEILAGALSYNNKYKVVGTKSYGKGTVQMTYKLYNGGAIKITTEYWLLPNGKRLDNQNPITPDTDITQDPVKFREGVDIQLEKALEIINQ